jgi:tetratricopeptide (TPR) repeat protein
LFQKLILAYHQRRALNAFASSNHQQALDHFQKIQKLNPKAPGINHNLALVHLARGNFPDAEVLFLKELETYGEFYPRLRGLADLYYLWGKKEQALIYYQRTINCHEGANDLPLVQKRIDICSDHVLWQQSRESLTFYTQAQKEDQEKRFEEAIVSYQKAAELDETNLAAWNNWGALLMNYQKEYSKARDVFSKALTYDTPGWILVNYHKVKGLVDQGTGET